MTAERPHGVIFDMDGLLLDTERIHLEAGEKVGREAGLNELGPVLRSMIGLRAVEARQVLLPALGNRLFMEEFESLCSHHVAAAKHRGIPVKPGVRELLVALEALQIPCAVATSTVTAQAVDLLQQTGLLRYFATVTGGDRVVHAKPDPEIYHTAAASLGIDACDAIVFEDSEPGTRAGIASGARTVQVPDIVAPSASLRALGHVVAADVMSGAVAMGLLANGRYTPT